MREFLAEHAGLLSTLVIASAAMLALAVVLGPLIVTRLPHDYFVRPHPDPTAPRTSRRVALVVLKNFLGGILILAGVAMLVLPGQGLLTLLLGLVLMDFRGKRALELWIIRRAPIQKSINWVRRRAGRPPLLLPAPEESPDESRRPGGGDRTPGA